MAAAACCTAGGSYEPPLYWALTALEATIRADSTVVANLVMVEVVRVSKESASLVVAGEGGGHA